MVTFARGIAILSVSMLHLPALAEGQPKIYEELRERTHPPRYERVSLFNPWGEDLFSHAELPVDFGEWVVAAAKVYADEQIRFDGYLGSEDDGKRYRTAADGLDNAFYGDAAIQGYREVANGVIDDISERTWICMDLPVHSFTLAGYPVREAIMADYYNAREAYTIGGTFQHNEPKTDFFFRRVRTLHTFIKRNHTYVELYVTTEQYRDPKFVPAQAMQPGDLVFFGHYGDPEGTGGIWHPKHSGIVGTVDSRGLPDLVYNMRVSKGLVDHYDGKINQTRTIEGQNVFFERFSDRYSIIGFGRITRAYAPLESLSDE